MPALASADGCRLLWFLHLAHGSGPAYTVVTMTGCRDAVAWAGLAERMRAGDLADWSAKVDAMRHGSEAKIVTPVPWSPLQEIDLAAVPTTPAEHELGLFMEDTAWPFPGGLSAYLAKAGTLYDTTLTSQKEEGHGIIELEAAFQPVYGSHHHHRGDPLAARREPPRAALPARPRPAALGHGAGHLDARRPGGARPVGEPAAPQLGVVAAVLTRDGKTRVTGPASVRPPGAPTGWRRR